MNRWLAAALATAALLFGGIIGWLLGQPQPTSGYTIIMEDSQ